MFSGRLWLKSALIIILEKVIGLRFSLKPKLVFYDL